MKYFKPSEFDCKHTGRNEMDPDFLVYINQLRGECGFPFVIVSGYRDPTHPVEARKSKPGTHSQGIAADIQVRDGAQRFTIVQKALEMGFTGIGVSKTFVHVDIRETVPVLWTY